AVLNFTSTIFQESSSVLRHEFRSHFSSISYYFFRTEFRDSDILCPIHLLYQTEFHDSDILCPIHLLYQTEFHDSDILCPIHLLYQTEFHDSDILCPIYLIYQTELSDSRILCPNPILYRQNSAILAFSVRFILYIAKTPTTPCPNCTKNSPPNTPPHQKITAAHKGNTRCKISLTYL